MPVLSPCKALHLGVPEPRGGDPPLEAAIFRWPCCSRGWTDSPAGPPNLSHSVIEHPQDAPAAGAQQHPQEFVLDTVWKIHPFLHSTHSGASQEGPSTHRMPQVPHGCLVPGFGYRWAPTPPGCTAGQLGCCRMLRGQARLGGARHSLARPGTVWQGQAQFGRARHSSARPGTELLCLEPPRHRPNTAPRGELHPRQTCPAGGPSATPEPSPKKCFPPCSSSQSRISR